MNRKPDHTPLRPAQTVAAAALATVVALSLLWGVATLFQSRGEPFAELAAAERACARHSVASEQRACMRRWMAEHAPTHVATR